MTRTLPFFGQLALYLLIGLVSHLSLAQTTPIEVPLWPKGAPGFENRRDEPAQAKDYWIRNIHNSSITVYLPPKKKPREPLSLFVPVVVIANWFSMRRATSPLAS